MGLTKVQELRLAFKCGDKYSSFLTIVRSPNTLNITESGLLWRKAFDASDVHISYPANGKVHFTFRKDREYTVHVYKEATTITCYTSSHNPTDLPDYNAIAIKTLPIKGMVKEGPLLNEFKKEDFYSFPTAAFVVEPESMTLSFEDKVPKSKYGEPIDLTDRQGDIINVLILLAGSKEIIQKMKFDTAQDIKIIKQVYIGKSPVIGVVVTAKPNQQ